MIAWAILSALALPLILSEFSELSPRLACRLLIWGAGRLGAPDQAERFREEWLAGLNDIPGKLTKLAKAVSIVSYTVPVMNWHMKRDFYLWPIRTSPAWERDAYPQVAHALRTRTPLAIALINVDDFKAVKDKYGHHAGNKALKTIARLLMLPLRGYDLVGRFGGDGFALLLPQAKALEAYRIAERIRVLIGSAPTDVSRGAEAEDVRLSVSIGVAALGARWEADTANPLSDMLAAAGAALNSAKQNGRNQVCVVTKNVTSGPIADYRTP